MKLLVKDYKSRSTPLCDIAKKYDTDKCAIRSPGHKSKIDPGHSHPYSIFYYDFFRAQANDVLKLAEVGILNGSSLKMWRDFFPNSNIFGYDNNDEFLKKSASYNFNVSKMDIKYRSSINTALAMNGPFDIIIEDTTHMFDDKIRFIHEAIHHLNPGGHLIVEDIFKDSDHRTGKKHTPEAYIAHILPEVISQFKDVYMVHLDHVNRRSPGWDNDGLLVFEHRL